MSSIPANAAVGTPSPSTGRAVAWVCVALLSFSTMAVAGREVAPDLDTFSIMFYRSLFGLAVVLCILPFSRQGFSAVKTRRLPLHLTRNAFHFAGQNLWFYAVSLVALAQVFALELTTPIWVALLAPLLLGERFTALRMGAILLGFAGILIVIRPGFTAIGPGELAAMACVAGFVGTVIATKTLTRTESTLTIIFWMTFSQAIMALIMLWGLPVVPQGKAILWVLLIGLCGLLAHFSLTQAYRYADATIVAPMDFLRLPLITVVGMILYREEPDVWVFVGGAVVFTANYLTIQTARRKN
ncbi:DMT family transporter [Denitrobaculum tricleocarpae]|uniref:DMT family transporter n=1 Tax=Denitrobaculum tricleocarpae TaxID=2591009 RepID=A0A545U0Y9_9PROT|nr:DMT family transporter [Denitrobaculum tricleocarpae]TQV83073.1 DMT family transporter [Denitrobaculum tricleocarpae]